MFMIMFNIQMTREEVDLTLRALNELRERGEVTLSENDRVANLVDYIEAEAR